MQKPIHTTCLLLSLGLLVLAGTGCSPKNKKAGHMAEADRFYAAGDYDKAEIEYKNVLQIEPLNVQALGRIGLIYFEDGRLLFSRSLLQRAVDLQPENVELNMKLGLIHLAFRDVKAARTKAGFVLDRAPDHPEAPLLLAETAFTPQEIQASLDRLKQLPPKVQEGAPVQLALGALKLREGKVDEAEAFFNRALALNPKYAEAHAALGTYYLRQKNAALAEQELKLAAELSPPRSGLRLQYAQLKVQSGDVAGGRKLAEQMTKDTPDYLPAWMMLANLASVEKKYDDSLALVGKVLARDSLNPDALLLSPRLHMAKGDFPQAVKELERALKTFPTSPQFLYQIGLAYVATGDNAKAIDSLSKALAQAPDYTDAGLFLASLQAKSGDQGPAIASLKAMMQKHPDMIQPRLLLADTYRGRGNLADALAIYDKIEQDFPGNPRTPMLRGMILLQQRNWVEARKAFNLTLERAPDALPAQEQLVNLDLVDKKFTDALQRVEGMIQKQPKGVEPLILKARVFLAQNQVAQAEAALQRAIEVQPTSPTAYYVLAGLQQSRNQQQAALDNLAKVLANNPKDLKALLMTGMLNEKLKQYDAALAAYEKILAIDPKSGIALNNAAYLYAENFKQLDRAFETAQKARELFPNEPHLADTLGWILVKRGQYAWAVTLLRESAEKLPTSADIQYHLGMACYMSGDEEAARAALETSIQLKQEFNGLEEARKALTLLRLDPAKIGPGDRAAVDAALAERPQDPVALTRLAALLESEGKPGKAIDAYQTALKASPANVWVMQHLIRIFTAQNDYAKAIDMAKAARKIAPDNTTVTLALGRLAFQTRDYAWSFSLLQEYVRKQPDEPAGLRDMARAAYSVGRVAEATASMERALQLDGLSSGAAEGRRFLDLLALANDPAKAAAGADRVAQMLKSNPSDVPALMAAATASEQKKDLDAAMATYEKVLELYPDFNPAKRRLVILLAATQRDNKRAFELALKARPAFPDDAELGKAYGIVLYRQGDFQRAQTTLKETAAKRADDAEVQFYLGMAQHQLKDRNGTKQSLQRALDLNVKAELAAEARKALTELK